MVLHCFAVGSYRFLRISVMCNAFLAYIMQPELSVGDLMENVSLKLKSVS